MNLQSEGQLFIDAADYLNKKYSSFLHPLAYDKIELTKMVIKEEMTRFLLNQQHTTVEELKNIIDYLFEFLFTLNNQTKLLYVSKLTYSVKSEFGDYYFEFQNIDFYFISNGLETMAQRATRVERLLDTTLKQIPQVLASYKVNDASLKDVLKKIFNRIPIDHYLIDNSDFLPLLHHLIKQYINKSSIFSPLLELRKESYVHKGSRDFIIKHPLHYEARYRNS